MPVIIETMGSRADLLWRDRVGKEERAAGRTPPKASPFLHTINSQLLACKKGEGAGSTSLTRSKSAPKMTASSILGGPLTQDFVLPHDNARNELFARQRPPPHPAMRNTSNKPPKAGRGPADARPKTSGTPPRPQSVAFASLTSQPSMRAATPPIHSTSDEDERSAFAGSRISHVSAKSVGSLVFREDDPPELWKNKLEELALRVELERLQRVETQTQLELHRRKALQEESRRFFQRSGGSFSALRADLGTNYGSQTRSSVDRIVFGHDIDGSEEVDGFVGESADMFAGMRKRAFARNQMKSDVDMIVFGHDIDGSGDIEQEMVHSNYGRKKDLRLFRGDADMAIFGRDQDHSNAYESYSRRANERF